MSKEALDLWARARQTLKTAKLVVSIDSDSAASRAYYAAFFAVSAVFEIQDQTFTKHTALEAAAHRNLVKTGQWPSKLGKDFSFLKNLRHTGDYGGANHVSHDDAQEAIRAAQNKIDHIAETHADKLPTRD